MQMQRLVSTEGILSAELGRSEKLLWSGRPPQGLFLTSSPHRRGTVFSDGKEPAGENTHRRLTCGGNLRGRHNHVRGLHIPFGQGIGRESESGAVHAKEFAMSSLRPIRFGEGWWTPITLSLEYTP